MKKLALGGGIVLVILVVAAAVCIHLFLDSGIKKGVETVGPSLTKTSVTLDGVSLSLLSGSGSIKGFVIGNPEGYKTPSAIKVGEAKLALKPSSLFSDKVVVNTINVQAPEITFETDLKGNNLSKIVANLESFSGPSDPKAEGENKAASRKLQVDDFLVTGGKINVSVTALGGKSVSVPLPDIHLQGLGQGPEGITTVELSKKVLKLVLENASKAAADAVADLSKQALDVTKGMTEDPVGTASKAAEAVKGLGGLLKKKK